MTCNNYGFIITRHVNTELANYYWNECIRSIQLFYPSKKIVVIDDNSKQEYVKAFKHYDNVEYVQSEFIGRGELLPYYYLFQKHYFDYAFILHDSVFIQTAIHFDYLIKFPFLLFIVSLKKKFFKKTNHNRLLRLLEIYSAK